MSDWWDDVLTAEDKKRVDASLIKLRQDYDAAQLRMQILQQTNVANITSEQRVKLDLEYMAAQTRLTETQQRYYRALGRRAA